MAEKTNIEWASSTGSPWFGCTEVSPGCANCYAKELAARRFAKMLRAAYQKAGHKNWETMPVWGNKAPRVKSKGFWKEAYRLDKQAAKDGVRLRMFPSMIDWLDEMLSGAITLDGERVERWEILGDFLQVVMDTTNLDWLLLTKRPENFKTLFEEVYNNCEDGDLANWISAWAEDTPPPNVWVGVSIENQRMADIRLPLLRSIPAQVRWVSAEPLLEGVYFDLPKWKTTVDWVVIGGESGKDRRDCGAPAIIDLTQQCLLEGVPVFVKQDCHLYPGQQGRLPDEVWKHKEYPTV